MKIELLPFQDEFLEPFFQWRSQADSIRHNPLKSTTKEELGKILAKEGHDLSDLKKFGHYRWFIGFEGRVVGNVSLKEINHMMMYGELGYGMDEAYQRRGIATAAVKAVIEKIFKETELRKLMAYVHDKNIASCRVMEKLGFTREGLLREHFVINGVPENEVIYGLLRRDWH